MDTHALLSFMSLNAPQLVGFILPPFVSVLNTDVKGRWTKFLITFLVCVIVSIFINLEKLITKDAWSSSASLMTSIFFVLGESQTVYGFYFKGSTLESKIEAKPSN